MEPCPHCGVMNDRAAARCAGCDAVLRVFAGASADPRNSTWPAAAGMALFTIGALLLLVVGFVATEEAITQAATFAGAAVCGIIARLCQASVHHAHLLAELRRK